MTKQAILFEYRPSRQIGTWGFHFDSLTELKFAISISDDYEFLYAQVAIYYDPGTGRPVDFIRCCDRRYTPDFLIRHKKTNEAFLIEIKPRAFEGHPQLLLRKEVAEHYIRTYGYDWQFKVVYDDEIILNEEQLEDYRECCGLRSRQAIAIWFEQYNTKLQERSTLRFSYNKKVAFVVHGNRHA